MTQALMDEVRARMAQIEKNKAFFGDEYHDYGLLFAQPNGNPLEAVHIEKWFKRWQEKAGIEVVVDMQGLRKSGQMYKLRLTDNNENLVAKSGRHSITVMNNNYNEVLEAEKMGLSRLVQDDFYPQPASKDSQAAESLLQNLLEQVMQAPHLANQLVEALTKMHAVQ